MISRRLLLASGLATLAIPARADSSSRLILTGTMEQGSLIVGHAPPGATATFDGDAVSVSPDGLFACGFSWDRTKPADIAIRCADGTRETRTVTPIVRQYDVQRVNGLPQSTVTPSPEIIDRIKAEHARLAAARKTDSAHTWFAEPFDWPAPGIMSGVFGSYRIDNGVPMSPHMGVDMANAEGTPIHAPTGAIVLMSEEFFLEGGFTLLDHGHGVFTYYMHQSARLVKPGDQVGRGDVIGKIGKTGRATGPHLHWGMNWFNVRLDPSRSTKTPVPQKA
ncbi:MAG: M23 family metallopeptidase [Proteobacteria bacterium]|nr:M23 family metallopeptidase [Pseudomonadota bacterium]